MEKKVKVVLTKDGRKVHVSCVEFGIEEYCSTEEEAEHLIEEKLHDRNLKIEYVKDFMDEKG